MKTKLENIVAYEILSTQRKGVHGGWWLFWLVCFYPALLIVLLIHLSSQNTYTVVVKLYSDDVQTLKGVSEKDMETIKAICAFK